LDQWCAPEAGEKHEQIRTRLQYEIREDGVDHLLNKICGWLDALPSTARLTMYANAELHLVRSKFEGRTAHRRRYTSAQGDPNTASALADFTRDCRHFR